MPSFPPTNSTALFNASDDTVDMIKRMLGPTEVNSLIGVRFADLKHGVVNFERYLARHDPEVVIFDISPPYRENWDFFTTIRNVSAMARRGLVLMTTNKMRLDEVVGGDSTAIEIIGRPLDLGQIKGAIDRARAFTQSLVRPASHDFNR